MSESGARRGDGTMLAALGGEDAIVVGVAERHGVTVANDNAPGQLVLSGERVALRAAGTALREAGVRILELNVAGAFHSPFMADAVPDFTDALAATYVRTPRIETWSCVTAAPMDDVRRRLAEGLTAPVRWRETVVGPRTTRASTASSTSGRARSSPSSSSGSRAAAELIHA